MESADSSTTTGAGAGTGKQPELPPGFRFHPTDEELVVHYLKRKAQSAPLPASIITDVDLYKFDPWELPAKAVFGEQEWYFFSPRDRKYPNGARPNRTATSGYWKATGIDKPVLTKGGSQKVAVKKALVFYRGKPPNGVKTDWIMHEYRLIDNKTHNKPLGYHPTNKKASLRLDDWVLCRIYKKNNANANKLNHHHHHHHPDHDESVDNMIGSIPTTLSMTHHHPHDHHEGLSDGMMNGGDATAPNNNLPMKQALPYLYWTDDVSMADRHTSVAVVGQLDGGFQQPYQLSSLNWYS